MKTGITLLLFIILINSGLAQHWSPFVENQISYYVELNQNRSFIKTIHCDSIYSEQDNKIYLFNFKSILDPNCTRNFQNYFNPLQIDSLVESGDSVLFIYKNYSSPDTFIFKPYSKLNENWITNDIKITCTTTELRTFWGIEDSVKTFKCNGKNFDDFEFILSKSFGFIKYLNFQDFLGGNTSNRKLIGYKNGELMKGYVKPEFKDYFNLDKGDKLFWKEYSESSDISIPSITKFYIDSIKYYFKSNDSVYYEYERHVFNENYEMINKYNMNNHYLKKNLTNIFQNKGEFVALQDQYGYNINYVSQELVIDNNDTITHSYYKPTGLESSLLNCEVNEIWGSLNGYSFSSRDGYSGLGSHGHSTYDFSLIGSIINGIQFGDTNIPNSVESHDLTKLELYPNPTNDYLYIRGVGKNKKYIRIIDFYGKECFSGIINDKIDLTHLTSGIYILIIKSEFIERRMKIIKK